MNCGPDNDTKACGAAFVWSVLLLVAMTTLAGCTNLVRPAPVEAPAPAEASAPAEAPSYPIEPQAEKEQQGREPIFTPDENGEAEPPSDRSELPPPTSKPYNLLPLLGLTRKHGGASLGYVGSYTRFIVENADEAIGAATQTEGVHPESPHLCKPDKERCYADEHRGWWARIFGRREVSRVLSVKVKLQNPDMASTATLASASYADKQEGKGETWNTEVNGELYLTPYFRIDSNSMVRIEARINASTTAQSQISGKALAIVQGATDLLSPGSSLLSTLTAPRLTEASQFMDAAISGLLSNELIENSASDFPQALWFDDESRADVLVTIDGWFPPTHKLLDGNLNRIGQWRIRVDDPVISIFSPVKVGACAMEELEAPACIAVFKTLTSSQVLNFRITRDLTLKQTLLADGIVMSAVNQLKQPKKSSASAQEAARILCVQIDEKAQVIGLNRVDAAALVWAFSHDTGLDSERGKALRSRDTSCLAAKLADDLGLNHRE
jgi:hypothetical protein